MLQDRMSLTGGCVARALLVVACAAGVGVWGGCASAVPRRSAVRAHEPVQGGSWELVLGTPESPAVAAGGWERSRNTGVLAARTTEPVLATNQWPEAQRPRLEFARRLQLSRRAEEVIYIPDERYPGAGSPSAAPGGGGLWWGP